MQRAEGLWFRCLVALALASLGVAPSACTKEHDLESLLRRDAGDDELDAQLEDEDAGEGEDASEDAGDEPDEDAGAEPEDAGSEDDGGEPRDACVATGPLTDRLDLLFMIDNSGSMYEEQKKLAALLPRLVSAFATGNRDGMPKPASMKSDFTPVRSLHIGVITSDMGLNGAPSQNSCGDKSFLPTERDPRTSIQRINKPVGDDGILQVDTAVATAGVWAYSDGGAVINVLAGDPNCAGISFPPNARFIDFTQGDDFTEASRRFSCIAKRGRNGCGLEQQLEATLKALTPPDSQIKFTALSPNGHGNARAVGGVSGFNQNFLREDALLAIVLVSDEEDCSIPDASRAIFDGTNMTVPGGINVRCGMAENGHLLHNTSRYVEGLKALKSSEHQDRIFFAGVVGVPLSVNSGAKVHAGEPAMSALLGRQDMQFKTQRNMAGTDDEPVPTCVSVAGDGQAAPGRRYLEVAKGFGERGLVTSICEDEYQSLLSALIDKIAGQLGTPATRCD